MEKQNKALLEGVIWKQLLRFFVPILIGTFFQQLYNTIDAVVVGNFAGKEALAAVGGSAAQISSLMVGFFVGLTSGASVVISQFYGANDHDGVSRGVHTALLLALLAGLAVTLLGLPFVRSMLLSMDTPSDTLNEAEGYLSICFIGTVPQLLFNAASSILRAVGDSKRPLYYLIACSILNTGLDLLFVAVFKMGAAGAALATVIAQAVSAAMVLARMARTRDSYRFSARRLRFDRDIGAKMLRIGVPAALQSVMYSASNVYIQAGVNRFGTDTVAAWTALGKIDGLHWMVMGAFGIAITTFTGQNFGARAYHRIRKGAGQCAAIALMFSALFSLVLYFWGGGLFYLFGTDQHVAELGVELMRMICPLYITYTLIEVLSGTMRGVGDVMIPVLMTLLGICVFRVVWVAVMLPIWPVMGTIVYSYPLSWAITTAMFITYYLKADWMRRAL